MDGKSIYDSLRRKKAFISDMDGVLYHGSRLLPGAAEFVRFLQENGKDYLLPGYLILFDTRAFEL